MLHGGMNLNRPGSTAALLTAAVCGLGAVGLLVKMIRHRRDVNDKIQRALRRRAEGLRRAEEEVQRYRRTHPVLSSSIVELSLSELREELQKGSVTPEEVLYSYMEKALAENTKLNCCTEILLNSFEQVKTVESNKDGLLYGVPISIKDNISYESYDNTCGLINCLDKPALKDSVVVEVIKKQGAIPFVKTNVPQALLSYDCGNPIYGETLNPYDSQRSAGGSSGGEASLIGSGGSLLGIGTDVGGSLRIPSSFCGICCLKPTTGRLSLQGVVSILSGQRSVHSTVGPMARDVDSLALFMQALLCDHMFALDPTVPPIPFNLQTYHSTQPLRIGYLENDEYNQPSPGMARVFREVKALLENAGHILVPYKELKTCFAFSELVLKGVYADGGATLLSKMKGDPVHPCFQRQTSALRTPKWIVKILAYLSAPWFPRVSANFKAIYGLGSVRELWEHHDAVAKFTSETIEYWKSCNIDVLLCPALSPAIKLSDSGKIISFASLSVIYNLLNFPAGVVPVSAVTAEDEEELRHYKGYYQDLCDRAFKQSVTGAEGLPLSVQCVALPWQEELCLRFMREVEKLVKESKK